MLFRFKDGGFQRMGLGIDNQQSVFLVDSKNPVSNPDHRTDLSTIQTAGSILSPGNSLPDFHLVNIIQKNTVAGSYIPGMFIHAKERTPVGISDSRKFFQHLHRFRIDNRQTASDNGRTRIFLLFGNDIELISVNRTELAGTSPLVTGVFFLESPKCPLSVI